MPHDINSRLSINEAADDAPDVLALVHRGASLTFSELAARVDAFRLEESLSHSHPPRSPLVQNAADRLAVLLSLYKCLQERRPFSPLHGKLSDAERRAQADRIPRQADRDLALILFTSGSTGTPKGVCLTRQAICASARSNVLHFGLKTDDVWLCCLPLSHIGGLAIAIRTLYSRSALWLLDAFDPAEVRRAIDEGATRVSLVPTMLVRLLEDKSWNAPGHLKLVLVGGASLPVELAESAKARGLPIVTSYGMTETGSAIAFNSQLIESVSAKVDAQSRLHLRGDTLMRGYLGEPTLRSWFQTGDLASVEKRAIKILGRSDRMIISGGENVHPAQVESRVLQCSLISECVAVARPDPTWGQAVAVIVASDGDNLTSEVASVCASLPSFARPRYLAHVSALPRGPSGKLQFNIETELLTWFPLHYS